MTQEELNQMRQIFWEEQKPLLDRMDNIEKKQKRMQRDIFYIKKTQNVTIAHFDKGILSMKKELKHLKNISYISITMLMLKEPLQLVADRFTKHIKEEYLGGERQKELRTQETNNNGISPFFHTDVFDLRTWGGYSIAGRHIQPDTLMQK